VQHVDGRFVYGATDLNNFLECRRLTELDGLAVRGELKRPEVEDEQLELIKRKGSEHEQRYLEAMEARYGGITKFERTEKGIAAYAAAEAETLAAMRAGMPCIYQATFFDGTFVGHTDFLRRIEKPSLLGAWSYEVIDTKLSLSAKPYFLIQLCNYSEHLARLQGTLPEFGYIVLGDENEEHFRLHDYFAYYRHLKTAFLAYVAEPVAEYPYSRKHCGICSWDSLCTKKRRDDDHLSLVAWMRRDQVGKLEDGGVATVAELAYAPETSRPTGMVLESFGKLRRQAELQVRGRASKTPLYEILPPEPATGFALMPEPARGDIFFDIEGDPLFEPGRGLEYLFGFWVPGEDAKYLAFWGCDRVQEKKAFENVVDFLIEQRKQFPTMHVYHYADYEKSALRKLAQLHGTREDEVDDLLRGEVFVDLYAVVRQALVISEESYGLKAIEKFYNVNRTTDVKAGGDSIVQFERWLLDGTPSILTDIENYNRDDCRSTYLLREWLLARRTEAIEKTGVAIDFRPVREPDAPCHLEYVVTCKKCQTRQKEEREEKRRGELERALLAREDASAQLLAHVVAYHRREDKPVWWAYFDRCENVDQLFEFDKEAIAHLMLRHDIEPYKLKSGDRNLVYAYGFPDQQHKMKPGDAHDPRTKASGEIIEIDDERNLLYLKRSGSLDEARATTELIPTGPRRTDAQREALVRIGSLFQAGHLADVHPATLDLLTGGDPRTAPRRRTLQPAEISAQSLLDVVRALDSSYLFIQGPPGSGKTTYGSQVVCDLLAEGKRVAVMSTGHKANHNMLQKVEECMQKRGRRFKGLYKHSGEESAYQSLLDSPMITSVDKNDLFEGGDYELAGGTSWLFAREKLVGTFDYLFIDEAGQVSLANALAASSCAKNVVLLGDPNQLAQVSQGSHPLEAGASILQHLLGEAQTVAPNRGIFLDVSYRMQPQICSFISDAMYEGRLKPGPDTALHHVTSGLTRRAGLEFIGVEHEGNSSSSAQEANRIVGEIALLREGGVPENEIIVVTPYNAQRKLIATKLKDAGLNVRVGTVDKFQGQEADVVFYSMAASSGEDVPRGTEFLFERNRFNVAVSRAKALSVLVCSPRLLDIPCNTPEQMALVNLLCSFVELGRPLDYGASRLRSG
jgi:uncharacterized protein